MITIVGAGIEKGDITSKGKKAIKNASYVFSRQKRREADEYASVLFSDAQSYEELDQKIVEHLLVKAKEMESVAFIVAGDGFSDRAARLLSEKTEVEVIAGVADNRGREMQTSFVTMSAYDIDERTYFDTALSHTIYQIDGKDVASDVKLCLLNYYDGETEVVLSDKKQSERLPLYEIDRKKKYDLACLFIPAQPDFIQKKRYEFNDLLRIMRRLTAPNGCPWDKAQTHESIRVNMIEEAYEAVDAIDKDDTANLIEELGDVLLQVVFHADMGERDGEFNLNDVISGVCEKLVSRHTHIFGDVKATDADSALSAWDKAKEKEKKVSGYGEQIARLPDTFPATLYAQKVIKKANKYGAALTKDNMLDLLKKAVEEQNVKDVLLFSVFYASLCGVDPEVEINSGAKKAGEIITQAENDNEMERVLEKLNA